MYATFLTRSGVLADFSVHSFVDLGITGWLVANLACAMVIGFGVLAWRWREIPTQPGDEPFLSRTVFFVLAISALLGTAAMVLLGTSAPLITRIFTKPSQVNAAFYNRVTLPIGILLATLLGVVPYLHWKGSTQEMKRRMFAAGGLAAVAGAIGLAYGARGVLYVAFLVVSLFAFFSNAIKVWEEARHRRFRVAGGYLAHVGLGLMLAGIVISSAYDRSQKVVLNLNEAKKVMGYTLTFRGVDKPTPTSRDAMLVEVQEAGGDSYIARPRMFRNEKSNQLVANPDVRVHLTHDVYVSPIEFDPGRPAESGATLDLGEGESGSAGPFTIAFQGFDMSGTHSEGQQVSVGARLEVRKGAEKQQVIPTIRATDNGFVATPAPLSGLPGAAVQIVAVDAGSHRVRLSVAGVGGGVAKRAVLHKQQTIAYKGATLAFDDFDLSDFDPQAGKINIGAVFKVVDGPGKGGEAIPYFHGGAGGQTYQDAALPGQPGVTLRIGRLDPNEKTVELQILDPKAPTDPGEPMHFSVDVTIKPMIGLLWSGLVVLLAGGILSVVRRGEEFATAVASQTTHGS